jgi:hypothetical protein
MHFLPTCLASLNVVEVKGGSGVRALFVKKIHLYLSYVEAKEIMPSLREHGLYVC